MTIVAGTRLGPYEIIAPLGAGGMGEVYRARDTRLDRSVAVKILPAEFANDVQLRARFEREAKTISQLNHPNICTLHDVGDNFLVMELLEGETLASRIDRGPMPLEQVIRYGIDVARALDVAHRQGVVHRDLKPGNVMITKSGAKVLDFGLAKSNEVSVDYEAATVQRPLTSEGMIIGTFQYMSPEQLEGQHVDQRTDIFAFGAVLYEMATGRRAFDGKTKTSLIAAIVAAQPKPVHELQPLTPAAFEHVISKCLAKDPEERWQTAHDIATELEWIMEGLGSEHAPSRVHATPWIFATTALALALILTSAAYIAARRSNTEPRISAAIAMPPRLVDYYDLAALSPDGNAVALVGYKNSVRSLWVRKLDEAEPHAIPGTENAVQPFWSPDGKSIGFFADGKLKRVPAAGGPAQVITDKVQWPNGATWNADNVIVFNGDIIGPLMRVDANGGPAKPVTKLEPKDEAHRWPQFLPDGEHIVFMADASRTEDHHVEVASLRDGSRRELMQGVTNAVYAAGYLLYTRAGSLLAQPFDAKKLTLSGDARLIAENIETDWDNHRREFTAAGGRLIYRSASSDSQLTWVDRAGKSIAKFGDARHFGNFQLAPDQKHVAVEQLDTDGRGDDLWLVDPDRNVTTRFTFDPASDVAPVWSSDGKRIAFLSMRNGGDIYVADTSNPSSPTRLTKLTSTDMFPSSWSSDGESLFMDRQIANHPDTDIYVYSFRTQELKPLIATPFNEGGGMISPDGTLFAWVSDESGHPEVYVARYPSLSDRRQISSGGGFVPRWRRDGRELFYASAGSQVMAADVTKENATPQPLFSLSAVRVFDVSPDGQRFLVSQTIDDVTKIPLTLVTNWSAGK
jgi:Tol biopolymer transport system component/predicted Ser/Thr protein kinase